MKPCLRQAGMYARRSIAKYLDDAASSLPAPGGGSVAALAGALGASMASMAANFTVGRERFRQVEPRVKRLLAQSERARKRLLRIVDEDVAAYSAYAKASRLPRRTEAEKRFRSKEMQRATKEALRVPLNTVRTTLRVLEISARLVDVANPNLISDVGVSAALAEGALEAASLNVEVNIPYLVDKSLAERALKEVKEARERAREIRRKVLSKVKKEIKKK